MFHIHIQRSIPYISRHEVVKPKCKNTFHASEPFRCESDAIPLPFVTDPRCHLRRKHRRRGRLQRLPPERCGQRLALRRLGHHSDRQRHILRRDRRQGIQDPRAKTDRAHPDGVRPPVLSRPCAVVCVSFALPLQATEKDQAKGFLPTRKLEVTSVPHFAAET